MPRNYTGGVSEHVNRLDEKNSCNDASDKAGRGS